MAMAKPTSCGGTDHGQVYIWLMNGSTLTSSGSLGSVTTDWKIAGVGDFNNDGKSDILWQNSTTGQVYLWLINGTTMTGGGSVSYVSSEGTFNALATTRQRPGRHPVAEHFHQSGLHLAMNGQR